ncbi:pentatricopeptide repeat-containing protein At5g27460 [Argentina anserina]|uniref:pentatricopeptide repeat-containing protein At5g27460 n=1 Tax=Argentina anserina TaxID=57926 RepID=UPI0021765FAB|nr:pentatricopeptide repeat-containing protein At5g27460 [Potentilla anserina]
MASRCSIAGLNRQIPLSATWRQISSLASSSSPVADLKSQIFKLKTPGRTTATAVVQDWVSQGRKVSAPQLRGISIQLFKSKRFTHALQVIKCIETQSNYRMSPVDHVIRLQLIIKVNGMLEAEEYFEQLTDAALRKAACVALLHGYVVERDVEKAEALMQKLGGLGLVVSPHLYNEMMKLYMATAQFGKVPLVVERMRSNKMPLTVLSYNLWMNACAKLSGVERVEKVYKEMVSDVNVQVGWSTLSTLAGIYTKAGLVEKAKMALINAEEKLSNCNRLGYFFLITQYTSLRSKEDVLRLWEASKGVAGRIPSTNYMHIVLCLVKLGDIMEADRVFREWECNCFKYDIRVSNVLLGAYMRNGMVEKAESLHQHTLDRGGCPNYKTWEILMEGRLKNDNMEGAVEAMKQGLAVLQNCHWRPADDTVMAFADYFERQGKFEDANWYIRVIHDLGIASLPLYKSLLRMCNSAQRSASLILKMMEKDKIEMDDEISALVRALKVCV